MDLPEGLLIGVFTDNSGNKFDLIFVDITRSSFINNLLLT
jgi:hypothetical protein